MLQKPDSSEYGAYYQKYIDRVPGGDLFEILQNNFDSTDRLVRSLAEEKLLYRYADGKWSIKEILVHIADGERIFGYRALRIARGDKTPLPGFDENAYAPESFADARSVDSILAEMKAIRESTIIMFRNFDDSVWVRTGTASNAGVSVRAIAYIVAGHEMHHQAIIRERYLP